MDGFDPTATAFQKAGSATLARLAAAAGDLALVIDRNGLIRDLCGDAENLPIEQWSHWIGRPWVDVVSSESRPKVEAMQRDASAGITTRWRHLNHPGDELGAAVPILYRVVPLGGDGSMLAIGRDLQEMADLQQRLFEVQQAVDLEERQRRQAQARQRLVFQSSIDPLLVVDSLSGKVFESNAAADALLPVVTRRRGAGTWGEGLDPASADTMRELLARVRASGRSDQAQVRSLDGEALTVSATPFREDGVALALVRIAAVQPLQASPSSGLAPARLDEQGAISLSAVARSSPEAILRTDSSGLILAANPAFMALVQSGSEQAVLGQSLDRWLDGAGVDLRVLMSNARQHGVIRRFSTVLRDEQDHAIDIELTAVSLADEDPRGFGFLIREAPRRPAGAADRVDEVAHVGGRSVEQLTQLVGRVPLKELVREAANVIERLAIEAALKLTDDNRALASDLLGLSRQSLYIKLHRYGLGDLGDEAAESAPPAPVGRAPATRKASSSGRQTAPTGAAGKSPGGRRGLPASLAMARDPNTRATAGDGARKATKPAAKRRG